MIGPADRTTFFEEQARNRRRTVRFAALATVTVGLTGVPLSILVTPALFLIVLIVAHLIQLASPLPPRFWSEVERIGHLLPAVVRGVADWSNTGAAVDWISVGALVALLVAPGMVVLLLLWIWVRLVFARAGTGGILLRIGARLPNPNDLEEIQLVNLVEEMAIASGVGRPRLMLLDVDAVNAAAVGSGPNDATLVITRGLLKQLDRAETQGIIAHLVGSVGNGDLAILNLLLSVWHTFGLLGILLQSSGSRSARRLLWRTLASVVRRGDQAEVERLAEEIANHQDDAESSGKSGCLSMLIAPFVIAGGAVQLLASLGASMLFGPPLMAMWRARRLLADATAVQLTRAPDGIAHALQRLTEAEVEFPPGASSRILFIHWPSYVGGSGLHAAGRFHPDLWRRIKRLEKSGAKLRRMGSGEPGRRAPAWLRVVGRIFGVIGWLLWSVVVAFMVGTGAFVGALAFGMLGAAIFAIHAFFTNLPAIVHFVRTDLPAIGKALWDLARRLLG